MIEDFRESAIKYISEVYSSHREQDIEAWEQLIDVIFSYCEELIKEHKEEDHGTT